MVVVLNADPAMVVVVLALVVALRGAGQSSTVSCGTMTLDEIGVRLPTNFVLFLGQI